MPRASRTPAASGATLNLTWAGNDTSATQTFTLYVNLVNQLPSFAASNPPTVIENSGAQTVTGWASNFNAGAAIVAAAQTDANGNATLTADLIVERRRLIDWVLDPIRALRGRT